MSTRRVVTEGLSGNPDRIRYGRGCESWTLLNRQVAYLQGISPVLSATSYKCLWFAIKKASIAPLQSWGTACRCSDWATGYTTGESSFDSRQVKTLLFSPKHPNEFWKHIQHLIRGELGALSLGGIAHTSLPHNLLSLSASCSFQWLLPFSQRQYLRYAWM